jgi:PAS domain S-box-containing protein
MIIWNLSAMPIQYTPYSLLSIVSAVVSLMVGLAIWRRRPGPGVVPFVGLMAALFFWSIVNSLNIAVNTLESKKITVFFLYSAIVTVMPLWFIFVMEYTGRGEKLTKNRRLLLLIHPIITMLTILTTDFHGIFWSSRTTEVIDGLVVDNFVPNWGFWLHAAYSYGLLVFAAILLVRWYRRSPKLYQSQVTWLGIAVVAPWIANYLFIFWDWPKSYIDPTPLAFTITGASMGWALYRFRMLDIVPVARDAIVENMADAIVVLDRQNRIVDVNAAAIELVGRPETELIGKPAAMIISNRPDVIAKFATVEETQTEIQLDIRGKTRTFDLRVSPLHNRQNELTGRVFVWRDISALKQINEDLKLAREQADEATRLKSQFLATMSHELRTPLNAIIGFSELMLTGMVGELSDNHYKYQERILANSRNLLALINDILDISKIEAGRMELLNQPFELKEWIGNIAEQIAVLATEKGLPFKHEIDPRLPETLYGDSSRLRQVVVNLLSNAIKFTHEGSVTLKLQKHDKDNWSIIVTDTGIGIPAHKQETIFQEFQQVDNSSTREYGGTGLGLAIVRKFVLMMGGLIRVQSNLGEGSTFTVILPMQVSVKEQKEPVAVNS